MGLRDMLRAIREYPAVHAELETARFDLRQVQQTLEKSQEDCVSLQLTLDEQKDYTDFLSHKAEALQDALNEFCPRLSTLEEMKRFYDTISPSMDAQGFTLYHMAKELTGIDVPSCFPYEDNRGMFEVMEGHQLLDWLTAVHFQAVEWEIIPNSTYESATLLPVDTSTPEYQAFEKQLYEKVLDRMGFQDILAPRQEVSDIENQTTELKLYSRLSGELTEQEYDDPQPMDGGDLAMFQDVILQGIEDEQMPEEEERGLMAYFDGSDAVNEKVVSLFPSVEIIDGELYGVAVCQISGTLTSNELRELKDYCRSQYCDGWGEGFAQRPRRTEYGELYVSFWRDNSTGILTKEEMEAGIVPNRPFHQAKKDRGEHSGR